MARTSTRTRKPATAARKTAPAKVELSPEVLALLTPAQKEALGIVDEVTRDSEAVPYLSCWKASRVNADAKGKFTHTNRRTQETRAYKRLSEAEAVKVLKANYAAGRVYAVPVR